VRAVDQFRPTHQVFAIPLEMQENPAPQGVGLSHAGHLAEHLAAMTETSSITRGSWKAVRIAGETLAASDSETLTKIGKVDAVILQLFNSTHSYAKTSDGTVLPVRKESITNSYHIHPDGDLVLQPVEKCLESAFEECLPVFKVCGSLRLILLSLLPGPEHVPNRHDPCFRFLFISALGQMKKKSSRVCRRSLGWLNM
jgi:hypothetical protein